MGLETDLRSSLIGARLDERYRVVRFVRGGGQGLVFEAAHEVLGSRVAIKVLESRRSQGDAGALSEARILTRVRHPHVVDVLDAGWLPKEHGPAFYIVMEWCEGPTLSSYLAARGHALTTDEAVRVFRPLLEALCHLHSSGVVHRDLKPSNVILRGGALHDPQLLDFGVAKLTSPEDEPGDTRTSSDQPRFTKAYAAPEQLVHARTGTWTDVHAAALLFVELVTGHEPYADPSIATALSPNRPTPGAFGIDIGPLESVLRRALALSPKQRPRSCAELLAEFTSALGDASARRDQDPATEPAPPGDRLRRPWRFVVSAALLGSLALGLGIHRYAGARSEGSLATSGLASAFSGNSHRPPASCDPGETAAATRARAVGFDLRSVSHQLPTDEHAAITSYVFTREATSTTAVWTVEQTSEGPSLDPIELRRRQRDAVLGRDIPLAYGVDGRCVSLLEAPADARSDLFDALNAQKQFAVSGDTATGPHPLRNPEFVRVPLGSSPRVATTLDELTAGEFEARVGALRWTPVRVFRQEEGVTIQLEQAAGESVIVTWARLRSRADASASVAALPRPAAYAIADRVAVWAYGVGTQHAPHASLVVLQAVLDGLSPLIEAAK